MPPVVIAAVIGAVATVGTSMYAANKQEKMSKEQAEEKLRLENLQRDREKDARQTAKPGEESVEKVDFGTGDDDIGSVSDFLVPRFDDSTGIGGEASGGLTVSGDNPLGFQGV